MSAGSIVTIVYEGDDDDMAERYLIGHIEEKPGELDVISPALTARRRADRASRSATRSSTRRPAAC